MTRTVLIVDDQKVNRKILGRLLKDEYTVIEASNGEEALKCLHRDKDVISAVLLDLIMPVMDGYTMLSKMMEDEDLQVIPVIVASQDDKHENELKALEMGARDYISKPYNALILKRRLLNLIELYESSIHIGMLKQQSLLDKMTGIYNRTALVEKIKLAFLVKQTCAFHLFILDVDNFKMVNDKLGHDMGDEALRMVASTLKAIFREQDCVCRMGGDEFAVFMQTKLTQEQLIRRLEMMQQHLNLKLYDIEISCSIGVCNAPENGTDYETLYHCADTALLFAKRSGKNRYALYDTLPEQEKIDSFI